MTIDAINERARNEAAVCATAVKIREILDAALREINLGDERDVQEEILELVTAEE